MPEKMHSWHLQSSIDKWDPTQSPSLWKQMADLIGKENEYGDIINRDRAWNRVVWHGCGFCDSFRCGECPLYTEHCTDSLDRCVALDNTMGRLYLAWGRGDWRMFKRFQETFHRHLLSFRED